MIRTALVVAAFASAQVAAQDDFNVASEAEPETFQTCLASRADRDCVGVVMRPCLETEAGMTTAGMVECAARELTLWDERLNERYGAFMDWYGGDEDGNVRQRERMQAAQRIWITLRDADCEVEAGRYEGGSLARVVSVNCLNDLTANRAIWINEQMREG
jgi:uncharacterized protein YecT (DUF1311 family)